MTHPSPPRRAGSATVLDRLIESLRAKSAPLDGQERPAAILWTDPKSEWRPLVELLLDRVEELLVLGAIGPRRAPGQPSGCAALWMGRSKGSRRMIVPR